MEIQKKLKMIAEFGCYFCCIIRAAKKDLNNVVKYYDEALNKGLIDEDCYIRDPVKLFQMLGREDIKTVEKSETPKANKILIAMYQWKNFTHFCLVEDKIFDPLGDSNTVKYGKIVSYRIFN